MTVLYLCHACEVEYGEPKASENCMSEHCGRPFEEVKEKSMTETPEFTVDIERGKVDGKCDYSSCEEVSTHLWYGFGFIADGESEEPFIGEYCASHSQCYAEREENMKYIGKLSKEDGSRYGVVD